MTHSHSAGTPLRGETGYEFVRIWLASRDAGTLVSVSQSMSLS